VVYTRSIGNNVEAGKGGNPRSFSHTVGLLPGCGASNEAARSRNESAWQERRRDWHRQNVRPSTRRKQPSITSLLRATDHLPV